MTTINHEYYVSLEVAKLLKEAGFDWPCNHAICCDSTHYPNIKESDVLEYNYLECSELMEGKKPHMLLCPTLDVAQRWLREVKQLEVRVNYHCLPLHFQVSHTRQWWNWEIWNMKSTTTISGELVFFKNENEYPQTYEEAQEAGIKKALELILEKGK